MGKQAHEEEREEAQAGSAEWARTALTASVGRGPFSRRTTTSRARPEPFFNRKTAALGAAFALAGLAGFLSFNAGRRSALEEARRAQDPTSLYQSGKPLPSQEGAPSGDRESAPGAGAAATSSVPTPSPAGPVAASDVALSAGPALSGAGGANPGASGLAAAGAGAQAHAGQGKKGAQERNAQGSFAASGAGGAGGPGGAQASSPVDRSHPAIRAAMEGAKRQVSQVLHLSRKAVAANDVMSSRLAGTPFDGKGSVAREGLRLSGMTPQDLANLKFSENNIPGEVTAPPIPSVRSADDASQYRNWLNTAMAGLSSAMALLSLSGKVCAGGACPLAQQIAQAGRMAAQTASAAGQEIANGHGQTQLGQSLSRAGQILSAATPQTADIMILNANAALDSAARQMQTQHLEPDQVGQDDANVNAIRPIRQ